MADEQKTDNQAPPGISHENDTSAPAEVTPPPSTSPLSFTKTPEMIKYEQMLENNPSSRVFAPLADLYRKAGMVDEAIALALQGVEKYPKYLSGRVSLGRAYFDKGMYDEARDEMERVVKITPDNLLANKVLGNIYMATGDHAQAAGYLERVLMFAPDDEEASRLLESIGRGDEKIMEEPPEAPKKTVEDDAINSVLRDLSDGEGGGGEIGEEFDEDFFNLDDDGDSTDSQDEETLDTLDLPDAVDGAVEEDIDDAIEDDDGIQEKMGDDDLASLVAEAKDFDDELALDDGGDGLSLDDDGDELSDFDLSETVSSPTIGDVTGETEDDTMQDEDSFEFTLDSTGDDDTEALSDEIDLSSMMDEIPEEFMTFDKADNGIESISLGESEEIGDFDDSVFDEDVSIEDFSNEFELSETGAVDSPSDDSGEAIDVPGIELSEDDLSEQDISMDFDFDDTDSVEGVSGGLDDTIVPPGIESPEEDFLGEDLPMESDFNDAGGADEPLTEFGDAAVASGTESSGGDLLDEDIPMEFDLDNAGRADGSSVEFGDMTVASDIESPGGDLLDEDIPMEFDLDDAGGADEPLAEFGDTTTTSGIELSGENLPDEGVSNEFDFDDMGVTAEAPGEFGDTVISPGIDVPQEDTPEGDLELSGDSDLLDIPGGDSSLPSEGMEGEDFSVDKTVTFDADEEMVELEDPFSATDEVLDEFVEQGLASDSFETPSEGETFEIQGEDTGFETPSEHSEHDGSPNMEPSVEMKTPPGMETPGFDEGGDDKEHDEGVGDDIDFHELERPPQPSGIEDRPLSIHEEFGDDEFSEDISEDDEDLLLQTGEDDTVTAEEGVSITTETIADIYVKQGHFEKAQGIYEELCRAYPENESLREKLKHVQMRVTENLAEEDRKEELTPEIDMSPVDTRQSERAIERLNNWLEDIRKRRRDLL